MANLQRDNHYVSQSNLRRFGDPESGKIWTYRTLVPHAKVPAWKRCSSKGIAFHRDLYTQAVSGVDSDDIEKWMNQEFESPAEDAIGRAIEGRSLTETDWNHIVKYTALHDVRSPKRLLESYERWERTLPDLIQKSLERTTAKLEALHDAGSPIPTPVSPNPTEPLVKVTFDEGTEREAEGSVRAEVLTGRALWLYEIRRALTVTVSHLLKHRWTILMSPHGCSWITSDSPVLKLNCYAAGEYDFGGGWGNKGSEIFFPLSPQHLLYTKIGHHQRPRRGATVTPEFATHIRRFICEHAYRMVFSASEDAEVLLFRPRVVDVDQFLHEKEQWRQWHQVHSEAERDFL